MADNQHPDVLDQVEHYKITDSYDGGIVVIIIAVVVGHNNQCQGCNKLSLVPSIDVYVDLFRCCVTIRNH